MGVALKILDLGMDTSTPAGRLMLTVIGAIGQFEREIMIERQRDGIAAAQAEGKYKGRAPGVDHQNLPVIYQQKAIKSTFRGDGRGNLN